MGKLIVLEGIDGSGKSTQFRALCRRLEGENRDFRTLVFPQYGKPSAALIEMYLRGDFGGDPGDVSACAASTFYAVDRYASYRQVWGPYYESGGCLVADRYATSNAVHQGAKLPPGERGDFFRWLQDFEYGALELPAPDLVLYMDIPLETALRNMRAREAATHTAADIHEQNGAYLARCLETAREAARFYGWVPVDCAPGGVLRPVEDIAGEVYRLCAPLLGENG